MITPTALQNIGYKMYIIYAIFNAWFALMLWFFYPETASRSLEQIDMYFARKYGGEDALRAIEQDIERRNRGNTSPWSGGEKDETEQVGKGV